MEIVKKVATPDRYNRMSAAFLVYPVFLPPMHGIFCGAYNNVAGAPRNGAYSALNKGADSIMKNMTVYIRSFTHAEKARGFLARHGIRSVIERTSGGGKGCGFILRIRLYGVEPAEVCALLGQIGIACDIPR